MTTVYAYSTDTDTLSDGTQAAECAMPGHQDRWYTDLAHTRNLGRFPLPTEDIDLLTPMYIGGGYELLGNNLSGEQLSLVSNASLQLRGVPASGFDLNLSPANLDISTIRYSQGIAIELTTLNGPSVFGMPATSIVALNQSYALGALTGTAPSLTLPALAGQCRTQIICFTSQGNPALSGVAVSLQLLFLPDTFTGIVSDAVLSCVTNSNGQALDPIDYAVGVNLIQGATYRINNGIMGGVEYLVPLASTATIPFNLIGA